MGYSGLRENNEFDVQGKKAGHIKLRITDTELVWDHILEQIINMGRLVSFFIFLVAFKMYVKFSTC